MAITPIHRTDFYRAWLLVPLVVGASVAILNKFIDYPFEPLGTVLLYALMSFYVGGVPYIIVVVLVWTRISNWSTARIRYVAVLMPVLFLVCLSVGFSIFDFVTNAPLSFELGLPGFNFQIIAACYLYVLAALATDFIFRKIGWIAPEANGAPSL